MRDDTLMVQRLDPDRLALDGDPAPIADPVGANVQNSAGGFTVSDTGVLAYRSRDARNRLLTIFDRAGAQLGSFGTVGFHRNPEDWSADGRVILFRDQGVATNSDLWVIPLEGARTPRPVLNSAFEEREGRLSPDGRWIAYVSSEPGALEVFVSSFPAPGAKW